jgi:hypothetical protein
MEGPELHFSEDEKVMEEIPRLPGLWDLEVRSSPNVKASYATISVNDSDFQLPFSVPPFYPKCKNLVIFYKI